jgi:two-component system sensor histidine kinase HupT/HoxJ
LLNARDALLEQPEPLITISASHAGGKVVLSVSDNGGGVSAEIRQKIFDPFFTTKPIGKGTGLGLAVSQQLIEEVGGSLGYIETQGHGACFQLAFNAA